MRSNDSGVGISNLNLGVIYELSGQQPMVKARINSPYTIPAIKREEFNKKKCKGYLYFFFLQFFAPKFILVSFKDWV